MCGDSGKPSQVAMLCEDKKVQLVHSDPPYNVSVQPAGNWDGEDPNGRWGTHGKDVVKRNERGRKIANPNIAKERKLIGDFLSTMEFAKRLHWWFKCMEMSMEAGSSFYIWGGFSNIGNYPPAMRSAGLYWSQCIIWVKNMKVLTRLDFMGQHEICFYGWIPKKGSNHVWNGPGNIPDVWSIDCVPRAKMVHLTEKPLEIPTRAIKYSSKEGDTVLDLFGGSGSTLIACENLSRHARLMEVDPTYCDVILARCNFLDMEIKKCG